MSTTKPSIAIIGAGPGGLVLARLLHLANIPFTLYEAEPHRASRAQGGTLDLQEDSGQLALRKAQLYNEFQKIARPEGEDMRVADKTGKPHMEEVDAESHNRPEVDRIQLRGVLLDSLPQDAIQWGHKILSIDPTNNSHKYDLHIQTPDGPQTKTHDLIVGADGAWSKVRPLLAPTKPHYSTISTLDCRIRSVDTKHPDISALVGHGSYLAFSNHKGLVAQRNGDGSIHIYIMLQVPQTWFADVGIDWTDPKATKAYLLDHEYTTTEDWAPSIRSIIQNADDDTIVPRTLHMLPPDFSYASKPGLTLLGDAAHLMTPFAGEGVNLAMLDAVDLSEAIITAANGEEKDLSEAVKGYETQMLERSRGSMERTWHNLELFFQDDAPRAFVREFQEMMREHGGGGGTPGSGGPDVPDLKA